MIMQEVFFFLTATQKDGAIFGQQGGDNKRGTLHRDQRGNRGE